jgi:MerR family mercuric resistance operon transcriptional regulator
LTLDLTQESIFVLEEGCAVEQLEFRIGEVATRAGVSVDTVRYYERLKLLPRARRTSGGFRVFGLESVERVQFIKQAQELGLTLDEIRGLLATGGAEECKRVHDLLNEKLRELDARLRSMKNFRRVLLRHLTECERELRERGQSACCPVLAIGKRPATQGKAAKKTDLTTSRR